MKKQIKIILVITTILIVGILSGCIGEADDKVESYEPTSYLDVVYSDTRDTAILVIEDLRFSSQYTTELVNTIDDLYNDGYEYIGTSITNPSTNAHNAMENYLIFRRVE